MMIALRNGSDTTEAEARVRDMRRGLELLYQQRRRLVRTAHTANGATNVSRAGRPLLSPARCRNRLRTTSKPARSLWWRAARARGLSFGAGLLLLNARRELSRGCP